MPFHLVLRLLQERPTCLPYYLVDENTTVTNTQKVQFCNEQQTILLDKRYLENDLGLTFLLHLVFISCRNPAVIGQKIDM